MNTASDALTHTGISLRDAIATANADAAKGQSDTIHFAPGLSGETITLSRGPLILSGAGSGKITINAHNLASLRISGNNLFPVFIVRNGVMADFDKLTIRDGKAPAANAEVNDGGGIANYGTLTVNDCVITGNFAANGGGIANLEAGTMTLRQSTVSDNSVSTSGGGVWNLGTLTLIDDTITANHAVMLGGGIGNGGMLTVLNSTVSGNVVHGPAAASFDIGGGIGNNGTMTVSSSLVLGNSAGVSGGIANNGTLTVVNSTLTGNRATRVNGGIGNAGTLTVVNATITGNSAGQNGGVGNSGPLALLNTIIAGNHAATAPVDLAAGHQAIAGGHNLIGSGTGLGGSGIANGDARGDIVGRNAHLAALDNNGAATTLALESNSPALFAGGAATTLGQGVVLATDITIAVTNGSVLSATALPLLASGSYFTIQVDGEEMAVTGLIPGSGTTATLTVVRGVNNTTATTHPGGSAVFLVSDQRGVTAPFSNPAAPSIGAMQSQGFIWLVKSPVTHTIMVGKSATFNAAVDANPAAQVQWQVSTNGGKTWTNLSDGGAYVGVHTDTLTVTGAPALDGDRYRAQFSNAAGTVHSAAATLTVDFVMFTGPSNETVDAGQKVTFTAAYSADPGAQVQWQVRTSTGTTWVDIPDAHGVTLSFKATAADNGNLYRVRYHNVAGTFLTPPAALSVSPALTVGSLTTVTGKLGESPFSGTLTVTGGTPVYSIKSFTGVPAGLHPKLVGGIISFTGTPNRAGTFAGGITIADDTGASVTKTFTITIQT